MRRLVEKNPRNAERIFPYVGGEEVNNSPTQAPHRYIINFETFPLRRTDLGQRWTGVTDDQRKSWLDTHVVPLDYPCPVAEDWPDLLAIVEAKVKPERLKQASIVNPSRWWMFARPSTDMLHAIRGLRRVLAINCGATPHMSFCLLPNNQVFANTLAIIALDTYESLSLLQSRVHEIWARFFASSMKDDLRYTPSDCFDTFPFPLGSESSAVLEEVGRVYYDFRAQMMIRHQQGLTTVYNWFHDPNSECPEIPELRRLHDAMDRAVLDAYGWTDIQPRCEFIPEFEDAEDEDDEGRPVRKKYRYRWPDETRDEVLARLLELNRQRAIEEGQTPPEAPAFGSAAKPATGHGRKKKAASGEALPSLLPLEEGES